MICRCEDCRRTFRESATARGIVGVAGDGAVRCGRCAGNRWDFDGDLLAFDRDGREVEPVTEGGRRCITCFDEIG